MEQKPVATIPAGLRDHLNVIRRTWRDDRRKFLPVSVVLPLVEATQTPAFVSHAFGLFALASCAVILLKNTQGRSKGITF